MYLFRKKLVTSEGHHFQMCYRKILTLLPGTSLLANQLLSPPFYELITRTNPLEESLERTLGKCREIMNNWSLLLNKQKLMCDTVLTIFYTTLLFTGLQRQKNELFSKANNLKYCNKLKSVMYHYTEADVLKQTICA